MPEWLIAVILGVVEGLTEFVPVSSTGHLIVVGHLLGFTGTKADTFDVVIQLGAIMAVAWLYRERLLGLCRLGGGDGFEGRRGLTLLVLTTLPIMVLGAAARDPIKAYLFAPATVAVGLGLGGVAILVVEGRLPAQSKTSLDALSWRDALAVGLFQCLALWPGVSRSAATILGAMLVGVERKTAAEYSFLAAIPVILAATALDIVQLLPFLTAGDLPIFGAGLATAFASAWFAVRFFLRLLGSTTLRPFGWYRIVVALLILAVLVWRRLSA